VGEQGDRRFYVLLVGVVGGFVVDCECQEFRWSRGWVFREKRGLVRVVIGFCDWSV
jgi:hypothetical protein